MMCPGMRSGDWNRLSGRDAVDHVERAGLAKWASSLHRTLLCFSEDSGYRRWWREKGAAERESFPSIPVGQETKMPDLRKPGREHMEQEAANELDGIQRHPLLLIAFSRVPPAERDLAVAHFQ